jgi:RNA polymerase sigma factor (sigma-70 family)
MMDQEALEPLLCAARAGDRSAFDRLQAALLPPAARFVRRLLGEPDAEEDLLREAFLALYQNLYRMDRPGALLPFLCRVLRNQCYDLLRRRERHDTVSLDGGGWGDDGDGPDWSERLPSPRPSPEESVQRFFLWAEVQAAVDRLPERQREVLILYADADLTYAGVAEALNLDPGTVRSLLYQARQNLYRRLRPDTLAALGVEGEESGGRKQETGKAGNSLS